MVCSRLFQDGGYFFDGVGRQAESNSGTWRTLILGGSDAAVDARMQSIFDVKYCAWSSAVRQEVLSDSGCSNSRSLNHKVIESPCKIYDSMTLCLSSLSSLSLLCLLLCLPYVCLFVLKMPLNPNQPPKQSTYRKQITCQRSSRLKGMSICNG